LITVPTQWVTINGFKALICFTPTLYTERPQGFNILVCEKQLFNKFDTFDLTTYDCTGKYKVIDLGVCPMSKQMIHILEIVNQYDNIRPNRNP